MGQNSRGSLAHVLPPPDAANVVYGPDPEVLRSFSERLETTTEYGSPAYVSEVKSRIADRTKNDVDHEFGAVDYEAVRDALARARETELVCLDRRVGSHPDHTHVCRLYVPREHARIALAWGKLLEPVEGRPEPDFRTLQVPDAEELMVRTFVDAGVTYVLGSDYTGETKKAFLRLFMQRAKQKGALGVHAGTRLLRVRDGEGRLRNVSQAFIGLSGTGKSTLTTHGDLLRPGEAVRVVQDDVCAFLSDGSVAGSEGGGLYLKAFGLDSEDRPDLYRAASSERTVLENVTVDPDGTVRFDDDSVSTNGRAVVDRADLDRTAEAIDLDDLDQVFFITRNPLVPPVARLTAEQAAAAFMLGESVETSAGDPERAGEPVRIVGTNPFIVGSRGREGNRFYELVSENDVEAFLLNTGAIGDGERPIDVEHSAAILVAVARGSIEWTHDDLLGLAVPDSVPGVDIDEFAPSDYVDRYEERLASLRAERRAHLESFEDLDAEVREAVY